MDSDEGIVIAAKPSKSYTNVTVSTLFGHVLDEAEVELKGRSLKNVDELKQMESLIAQGDTSRGVIFKAITRKSQAQNKQVDAAMQKNNEKTKRKKSRDSKKSSKEKTKHLVDKSLQTSYYIAPVMTVCKMQQTSQSSTNKDSGKALYSTDPGNDFSSVYNDFMSESKRLDTIVENMSDEEDPSKQESFPGSTMMSETKYTSTGEEIQPITTKTAFEEALDTIQSKQIQELEVFQTEIEARDQLIQMLKSQILEEYFEANLRAIRCLKREILKWEMEDSRSTQMLRLMTVLKDDCCAKESIIVSPHENVESVIPKILNQQTLNIKRVASCCSKVVESKSTQDQEMSRKVFMEVVRLKNKVAELKQLTENPDPHICFRSGISMCPRDENGLNCFEKPS